MKPQKINDTTLPEGYIEWKNNIEQRIESAKFNAALHVNTDMLELYWQIGSEIIEKQKELGWGKQVIDQLSRDLTQRFPNDKGYSVRNLHNMRRFAAAYPAFPILQVPLAEFKELPISQAALAELSTNGDTIDIPLTIVSWYHHISLLPKIENEAIRAFYILEASRNGWSTDVMLSKFAAGYMESVGKAITNFKLTLPSVQSDFITQPMGIAQYETEKLFNEVASALPTIEGTEKFLAENEE